MSLLSNYELRVLRAIDQRPGGTTAPVIGQMTGYSEPDVKLALNILEHDELVTPSTVQKTGTTWWRITRKGVDQLIRTPPSRAIAPRAYGNQLPLGSL